MTNKQLKKSNFEHTLLARVLRGEPLKITSIQKKLCGKIFLDFFSGFKERFVYRMLH